MPRRFNIALSLITIALLLAGCSMFPDLLGELQNLPTQVAVVAISLSSETPKAATRTPFQPVTHTPTLPATPSPTATETPTPENTPTAVMVPSNTPSATPTEPPTPTVVVLVDALPAQTYLTGIVGYAQSLPLSCESRSAVDWARFYGVEIGELDFQYALPSSDNPNTGFVGNASGARGQIPPYDYGVHAAPVAALLRSYGLSAQSRSAMSWYDLRRAIASGNPVIVWVIGNVWTGYGQSYSASDGETLTVAAYEHTVIVTGYTQETVTVVDGALTYAVSLDQFLQSWSVLGYMGIVSE